MRPITIPAHVSSRSAFALGASLILFGCLAVAAPAVAGLAVSTIVAVLLVGGGIARTIFAFKAESFGSGALVFLAGVLSIACGGMMLAEPILGLASLTIVLAAYFVADGVVSIVDAFRRRGDKGWGWGLAGGACSLALAWMVGSEWPLSGNWAIGVLAGVHMIFGGSWLMILGASGDAVADEVDDGLHAIEEQAAAA